MSNGGLDTYFNLPEKAAGTYTITALGVSSGKTFTGTVAITAPSINIDPSTSTAGAPVTVTGSNFALSGNVNMTFNGAAWGTANISLTTSGSLSQALVIPALAVGTYTVTVTDGINTATRTFVIPAPTITLSTGTLTPTTGPVGSTVYVKGRGFSLSGLVNIYFAGTLVWSAAADTVGNLSASTGIPITIPDKTAGSYDVVVVDATTGTSSNTATFTVAAPTMKVAPTTGPVASAFIFNATNFKINTAVNVKFNGVSLANITSSSSGAIANNSIAVPSVVPGTYAITATDGINTPSAVSFTVPAATVSLSPSAGPAATSFNVVGTNFKVSSAITITFNGTAMTGTTSNSTGGFVQAETVPAYPIGAYTVNVTDGITYALATFNIGAAISALNATTGPVGSGILVTGTGFTNSQTVEIYFGATLMKTVTATSGGALPATASFTVPNVVAGIYAVTAKDVNSSVITPAVNYTVATPLVTLAAVSGQVGNNIMVTSGTLFKLDAAVTITFNGVQVSTTTADHTGTLAATANFTVPSVVPGTYTVNVTDGVNTVSVTFNVFGTGGIDTVTTIVTSIQTTLATNGNFYNFTNNWFTTINAKLGTFTGNDTVASLLYSVQNKLNIPSGQLKFSFGGATTAYDPAYTNIANTTLYGANGVNWGWTDVTGMQWRDRGATSPSAVTRTFVNGFTNSRVFQVALPNGNYVVSVTQGDSTWAHDKMTIIANGDLKATTDTAIGQFVQSTFSVTVNNGLLQLTFGKAAGAVDGNWVVNAVTIQTQP